MTLEMALGMSESEANEYDWRGTDQGIQMKASPGENPGWNGTNLSGFSGLPGGNRQISGEIFNAGNAAYYWCSSQYGTPPWHRILTSNAEGVLRFFENPPQIGFSVRCIQDTE
jgi:uncharacterized protein (TIGR02145 family)